MQIDPAIFEINFEKIFEDILKYLLRFELIIIKI